MTRHVPQNTARQEWGGLRGRKLHWDDHDSAWSPGMKGSYVVSFKSMVVIQNNTTAGKNNNSYN